MNPGRWSKGVALSPQGVFVFPPPEWVSSSCFQLLLHLSAHFPFLLLPFFLCVSVYFLVWLYINKLACICDLDSTSAEWRLLGTADLDLSSI